MPIGDTLGVRVAGMMTKRDGYDYNTFFGTRINGRDLWSTRATVAWEPSDRFKANVIWQHFEEDDNRSRSAKQLCTTDPGPETIGSVTVHPDLRGRISQGCLPGSLYDDAAFGKPNSDALVYLYFPSTSMTVGNRAVGNTRNPVPAIIRDPMGGGTQSRFRTH
jgi:iron complex outermembrane recepter protein